MTDTLFSIYLSVCLVWLVVSFARTGREARRQRKQTFPEDLPDHIRFRETSVSGRCIRGKAKTYRAGSGGCLELIVTDREIWLRTARRWLFPFSGAEWGLMHRIALGSVETCTLERHALGEWILLSFQDAEGAEWQIRLKVADTRRFLDLMPTAAVDGREKLFRPADASVSEDLLRPAHEESGLEDAAQAAGRISQSRATPPEGKAEWRSFEMTGRYVIGPPEANPLPPPSCLLPPSQAAERRGPRERPRVGAGALPAARPSTLLTCKDHPWIPSPTRNRARRKPRREIRDRSSRPGNPRPWRQSSPATPTSRGRSAPTWG